MKAIDFLKELEVDDDPIIVNHKAVYETIYLSDLLDEYVEEILRTTGNAQDRLIREIEKLKKGG